MTPPAAAATRDWCAEGFTLPFDRSPGTMPEPASSRGAKDEMDATLESLILRARAEHDCRPGATFDEIADAEKRLGHRFTDELRQLLAACNGIQFWKAGDHPSRLLSTREIAPVHCLLHGDEGPRGLVAIVESAGDFVGMGLDPQGRCHSRLVDCSHETYPDELLGVCGSLKEMLVLVLDSNGEEWIWPAARAYGVDFAEGAAGDRT